MLFIDLYHGDLYSDLWKSDLYFRPVAYSQCVKKVLSDSPGLVDFAIGLVTFVLNLPEKQVLFFGKFKLQKDCNQSC